MSFSHPYFLVLGLVAASAVVLLGWRRERERRTALARFAAEGLLERLTSGLSPWRRRVKIGLLALAVASVFTALARPQLGYRWEEVRRRGIDILLAVDTSKSMLATDTAPNRLARAKLGIEDFVDQLEGDRVGLLPFSGGAFLFCPLTLDHEAFKESLGAVDEDLIPEGGTDIAKAIREARSAFADGANHKILVLITDGEDLGGDALDEAEKAATDGIVIHTVGVGTPAGELIPYRSESGRREFVRDERGDLVTSKLDEDTLQGIAAATGGLYQPLGRGAEGLEAIYREKLRLVPKEELSQRKRRVPLDRFEWPLMLAALLLLAEFLLGDRKRRSRRGPAVTSALRRLRRGSAAAAVVAAFLFIAAYPARAEEGDAEAAYAAGSYTEAAESWRRELARSPTDLRLHYNAAAAAYKSGDFETAAAAFREALPAEDLVLQNRAYYGLGNALFRLGEATADSAAERTIEQWKEAIQQYDGALELDPHDEDAAFNREVVKRRLEEIERREEEKQQQQQQRQQQDPQQDRQDQQDQQDQQNEQDQQCSNPQEADGGDGQGERQEKPSNGEHQDDESEPKQDRDEGAEQTQRPSESAGHDGEEQGQEEGESQDSEEASQDAEEPDVAPGATAPEAPDTESQPASPDDAPIEAGTEQEAGPRPEREARRPGRMTLQEAKGFLDSVKDEQGTLRFVPQRRRGAPREDDERRRDW